MNVDFSRVKKSPIPKTDAGVLYFRGDGIKIHVYAERMRISDAETGIELAVREGDYTQSSTGEIKKLAAAMLNRAERKPAPYVTEPRMNRVASNKPTQRITPKARHRALHSSHVVREPLAFLLGGRALA